VTKRPKAYSYLRFSTPGQLEGDSLRRQTEAARDYAERHGLELDTALNLRDLGVSAFRGKNAVEGALGAFIGAVDSGKVKKGSYLLVESLDRLSRDRIMAALTQFADLLGKGVRIVTLSDGQKYDESSLDNLQGLIVPLAIMSRANEESEMKSKRGRAAWEQKKKRAAETGELVTRSVPAWIRVRDGKMEFIARKAKVVQRIFELARDGWGTQRIARTFNVEGVPVFGRGNGWTQSYIRLILKNAAVIGQYQPMRNIHKNGKSERVPDGDPIDNYFPPVIEPSLFYSVKHSKRGPSPKGDGLQKNLLSKLVFCGKCGAPCHYVNKGRGNVYLVCDNRRRFRSCDALAVPYFATFSMVLLVMDDFRSYDPGGRVASERDRQLDTLAGQIAETQEVIGRLVDSLERVHSATMEQRLVDHEATLAALTAQRTTLKEKATAVVDRSRPLDLDLDLDSPVSEYIMWEGERTVPKDKVEQVRAGRAHIAAEIRRLVARVEIEKGQPVKITPTADGEKGVEMAVFVGSVERIGK
jgi:DNA invertase Pin-like site-specific DNA recombinase